MQKGAEPRHIDLRENLLIGWQQTKKQSLKIYEHFGWVNKCQAYKLGRLVVRSEPESLKLLWVSYKIGNPIAVMQSGEY